ncbi:response regulator [Marmoricola sp. URHB0036]|uniref:ATP-binding response regulator n=1 Tax=Marmoricola sp. URHB0036 TaxID=1298863 RepID=UPI0003FD1878|nr:response regulator [Marmoricola sp. URHB0036]
MSLTERLQTTLRVVIIDDSADLREVLRMTLERAGTFAVVGEAGNGREGADLVAAQRPDVALLDIMMPDMDGLEALSQIRSRCPETVIVMLSSLGSAQMTLRALTAGADGYVQKGRPLSELLAQMQLLVAKRMGEGAAHLAPSVPGQVEPHSYNYLDQAPFGLVHVRGSSVVLANREATRMIGDFIASGAALADVSPALAAHLAAHPDLEGSATLTMGDPPRQVQVKVRRSGNDRLVYLHADAGSGAELLRRAIATTAHELRGPIGVLMAAIETVTAQEEPLAQTDRTHLMEVMGRQVRLLEHITADLLTAAQAQHGTVTPDVREVDAVDLVGALVPADVELQVSEDRIPAMVVDPLHVQQMLGNLLSNAAKYGAPPLLVRLSASGVHVRIDVEDNGPGVPPDFRPRLFEEYARAPGTSARGTGLGLFVVRALAAAGGGSVAYTPREPNGSVFTLLLPAAFDTGR